MSRTPPVRATFNPGPSQLDARVAADLREIEASGLLVASHRSSPVKSMVLETVERLREALGVPDDHTVVFQPSATAAMEFAVRNLTTERTAHFVGGAFAERFASTAEAVGRAVHRIAYPWSGTAPTDAAIPEGTELLSVTHNETSTGAIWPAERLVGISTRVGLGDSAVGGVPGEEGRPLLAVDVTSSMGGVAVDFGRADLWFASVQKALGLPAGLAVVIVGPAALERARRLGAERRVVPWQDLVQLAAKMETGQTVETPNVLGIALLGRRMARLDLDEASRRCCELSGALIRARTEGRLGFDWFVEAPAWRSPTVQNLVVEDPAAWHERARAEGFLLGSGYGDLKGRCIRIATFPAHEPGDLEELIEVLGE